MSHVLLVESLRAGVLRVGSAFADRNAWTSCAQLADMLDALSDWARLVAAQRTHDVTPEAAELVARATRITDEIQHALSGHSLDRSTADVSRACGAPAATLYRHVVESCRGSQTTYRASDRALSDMLGLPVRTIKSARRALRARGFVQTAPEPGGTAVNYRLPAGALT